MQQPFAAEQPWEKRSCVEISRAHCAAEKEKSFL